jgi:hypothetical protein
MRQVCLVFLYLFLCSFALGNNSTPNASAELPTREKLFEVIRSQNALAQNVTFHTTVTLLNRELQSKTRKNINVTIAGEKYITEALELWPCGLTRFTQHLSFDGQVFHKYTKEKKGGDIYSLLRYCEDDFYVGESCLYPFPYHDANSKNITEKLKGTLSFRTLQDPSFKVLGYETLAGQQCVAAELYGGSEKIWFSVTQGYRPVRREMRQTETSPARLWEVDYAEVANGFWFPFRGKRVTYAQADAQYISESVTYTVDTVAINQNLNKDTFDMPFPVGLYVYDHRAEVEYRAVADATMGKTILAAVPDPSDEPTAPVEIKKDEQKNAPVASEMDSMSVVETTMPPLISPIKSTPLFATGAALLIGFFIVIPVLLSGARKPLRCVVSNASPTPWSGCPCRS